MTSNDRYARQTMLPEIGEEGQKKLRDASVLIVGAGGLGSAVATYLTGAGVGTIGIADHDTVGISNLQRQTLYTEKQIGLPKTVAAKDRLAAMSSETTFLTFPEGLTPENAAETVSRFDLVIDCCDNFTTRFLIDDTCHAVGKPWVHGCIGAFGGQVAVFNLTAGCRYSDLYPDRDHLCSLPQTTKGVVGYVPGVIGCLQAGEAIKVITGFGEILDGKLFAIDCKEMTANTLTII